MTHWADVEAERLLESRGKGPHVFATAITPSGPIHVGNMREVLTTEAIFRATRQMGGDAELIYIADDYDPLRKVYPFLDAAYEEHVGKPLREIPCPDAHGKPNGCGAHDSYAAHFLGPFLDNLAELGIEPTVMSAYDLYYEGRYVETTLKALNDQQEVRSIIEAISKRQLPKRWVPFNPQCPSCRRISGVEVLSYVAPMLHCKCAHCATGSDDPAAGTFDVDASKPGIGKLPWRVDWPARWSFLGVTFEAFGKDHGAKGGSWDTGVPLVRDIFGGKEPEHVMYEFLNLKGQGAMHSSSGLAVSASDVLQMTPPEVLRYLLMRQSPRKHIDFDPGLGVLNLVDEFDRLERIRFGLEENPGTFTEVERTYELSCPREAPAKVPNQVPYRHLVTVAQIAEDVAGVEDVLRRSGELTGDMDDADRALLAERVDHVRFWLARFAPDGVRFEVQAEVPEVLEDDDRAILQKLGPALAESEWSGQDVHDTIHNVAASLDVPQKAAFRAVYRAILGRDRGPRAGFFVSSLDKAWVVERFAAAS